MVFKVTYSENGFMAVLLKSVGFGMTFNNSEEDQSLTITFKLFKVHAMFSLALI